MSVSYLHAKSYKYMREDTMKRIAIKSINKLHTLTLSGNVLG